MHVDVLIITALPEEHAAARAAAGPEVVWREHGTDLATPYLTGAYRNLVIGLARPTRMGGRSTGPLATTLTDLLTPVCLAMCGVCAGHPDDTTPGDVIVASPAFAHDEGKQEGPVFRSDVQQFPLDDRWLRAVQNFDPSGLPSHGHGAGRLPFAVQAGPMASGNAVMADPGVWQRLRSTGIRKVLALEMEAATIATVAHARRVPHWLVAKGVMDNADLRKDDRFKEFAARASAEVLYALLAQLVTGAPAQSRHGRVPGTAKLEVLRRLHADWREVADVVGVPGFERARFARGEEPRGLWDWLENRDRLTDLPGALAEVGRADLVHVLRPYL